MAGMKQAKRNYSDVLLNVINPNQNTFVPKILEIADEKVSLTI